MRRSAYAPAAGALAAALLLAACSPSSDSAEQQQPSQITMLEPEPTQGLDPNVAAADASRGVMAMMYETLVERDNTGEIVGALAKDWKVSPDGKTYTFTLRDEGFSDGSPVTADDVVFSIERMKRGAAMKKLLSGVEDVEAVDDKSVRLTLAKPDRSLLITLSRAGNAAILSKQAVKDTKKYFTKPTTTSGPWQLADYVPKSHMTFTVNPNYFRTPKIDKVVRKFATDPTSNLAAVQSGSADIGPISYSDAQVAKESGSVNVFQGKQLAPLFFGWDRTKPPFSDVHVRQAVAYAIDREARMRNCWFGTGANSYGNILLPNDQFYLQLDTYKTANREEALDKARTLLGEAGWQQGPDGMRVAKGIDGVEDGTRLHVEVPYESNWQAAACHVQLLQRNLADVGFDIKPRAYDPAAYWGDVAKGKFTMYHGGAGATGTFDLFINWFHTGGALTALTTHLSDPKIDAKIDRAMHSTDDALAREVFQDLQRWQARQLPVLVDGFQWPQVAVSKRVQGYQWPADGIDSYNLVTTSVTE